MKKFTVKKTIVTLLIMLLLAITLSACTEKIYWEVTTEPGENGNYTVSSHKTNWALERWYCTMNGSEILTVNVIFKIEYGAIESVEVKVDGAVSEFTRDAFDNPTSGKRVIFLTSPDGNIDVNVEREISITVKLENKTLKLSFNTKEIKELLEREN
ncbi:MAG: hypothetical protein FWD58_11230 [Firmicutes bacterium]|nr:hypothetical protein [Bacillota bacterium]